MTLHPVGLSRDLPSKRVMRAEVDGLDIVVWRATDGTVRAWDNRCPHRGMALSHGFVRGNSLACLYHGWHYGTSGRCNYIPAHPELEPPETIRVSAYDVAETGGVIWVSTQGQAGTTPSTRSVDPAATLHPLRSFIVYAAPDKIDAASAEVPFDSTAPKPLDENSFALGEDIVRILCNPIASGTFVSVLTASVLPLDRRRKLSRWCEAMRRAAEKESET